MTRRERLEHKLQKRREWAEGRARKAEGLRNATPESLRHDWAFITQPGHIPERARMIRRAERAMEHDQMARHHRGKAAGLAQQLDDTIFSDDDDATQELEARIENNERERERMKAINAAWRKAGKPAPDDAEGWRKVADDPRVMMSPNDLRPVRLDMARAPHHRQPFPGYALSNLGGRITADRKRIKDVERRRQLAAEAEEAGGVAVRRHEEINWCVVTFAEKPERAILDGLRAAGYGWGGGSWQGYLDRLPASVEALEAAS
jgi:hypothetical protein